MADHTAGASGRQGEPALCAECGEREATVTWVTGGPPTVIRVEGTPGDGVDGEAERLLKARAAAQRDQPPPPARPVAPRTVTQLCEECARRRYDALRPPGSPDYWDPPNEPAG